MPTEYDRNSVEKDESSPEAMERARLRRNQRNSRARKQAYIQDLEQRWARCVEAAQSTVEMQKAARKVQEENQLLRQILYNQGYDHVGIQHAIEAVRRGSSTASSSSVSPQLGGNVMQMQMQMEMQMNQNLMNQPIDWTNIEPPFDFVSSYISY